jgi:hypothetical protein
LPARIHAPGGPKLAVGRAVVDGIMHLTGLQLDKLLETCAVKYEKAMIEPGACHMHQIHALVGFFSSFFLFSFFF